MEAEYQRLMRDELVQSKLASFDIVDEALTWRRDATIDEGRLLAFMQSINSIRLVLGTMLGVTDDPDVDEVKPGLEDSPEYAPLRLPELAARVVRPRPERGRLTDSPGTVRRCAVTFGV